MTIDDNRLVKDMVIACEGLGDLEDCMVAALQVVKKAYEASNDKSPANTALVKKLVEALQIADARIRLIKPQSAGEHECISVDVLHHIEQSLTEAKAWLERQGKCGEGILTSFDEPRLIKKALDMYGTINTEQMFRTVKAMRELNMSPHKPTTSQQEAKINQIEDKESL